MGGFRFFAIPSERNNFIPAKKKKKGLWLQGGICSLSPELDHLQGALLSHLF